MGRAGHGAFGAEHSGELAGVLGLEAKAINKEGDDF